MKKALTYDELIDLAKKNYNKGGDGVFECWDERTFNEYVKEFGQLTKTSALKMFRLNYEIEKEERAAARYFGGI